MDVIEIDDLTHIINTMGNDYNEAKDVIRLLSQLNESKNISIKIVLKRKYMGDSNEYYFDIPNAIKDDLKNIIEKYLENIYEKYSPIVKMSDIL